MKNLILLAFLCLWIPLWAQGQKLVPYCETGVNKPCKTLVYYSEKKEFGEAEHVCRRNGGHLASVHSLTDNDRIHSLIMTKNRKNPRTWIGGYRLPGKVYFYWTDGAMWSYHNWYRGEPSDVRPSEQCVEMNYEEVDGRWDGYMCSIPLSFVCAYTET